MRGYRDIVELLANELPQADLTSAADKAIIGGHEGIVRYLLDTGRVEDITAVAITAAEYERPRILLEALRRGADIKRIFIYSQSYEEDLSGEFMTQGYWILS